MSREADAAGREWEALSSQERQARLLELEKLPMSLRMPPSSEPSSSTVQQQWRWSVWNMSLLAAQAQSEVRLEELEPEIRRQFEGEQGGYLQLSFHPSLLGGWRL